MPDIYNYILYAYGGNTMSHKYNYILYAYGGNTMSHKDHSYLNTKKLNNITG
jgi:hypothetical protein